MSITQNWVGGGTETGRLELTATLTELMLSGFIERPYLKTSGA